MLFHLFALILAMVLNAGANLLLKVAARQLAPAGTNLLANGIPAAIKSALTCPTLILGILLFALNIPLYAFALTKFKVSLAYPIMVGGGFALIASVAAFSSLGERLTITQWLGVTFILVGVILLCGTLKN